MTPPSKDNEGILEFKMGVLEKQIETLEEKVDLILEKLNGLNCPTNTLRLETIEKRLDKLEDQKSKPAAPIDIKFVSEITGVIVKAVVATAAAIFGLKQL